MTTLTEGEQNQAPKNTVAAMTVILSVNAGSSSIKVSAYEVTASGQPPKRIAEAQISGLTAPPTKLTFMRSNNSDAKDDEKLQDSHEVKDIDSQTSAFMHILDVLLKSQSLPQLGRKSDIDFIAHRIVHGGDAVNIERVGPKTLERLDALSELAPLHNQPSLDIVKACMDMDGLDGAVNVACFDTQFHVSIPRHIHTYPIDQARALKNGLRKYGFHGISYSFITQAVAKHLGKPAGETSLIALHLGSGASACAIQKGRSRDTSMGLTPVAGLPGATRSGSVDPSLVFHYASDVGNLSPKSTRDLHISRAEEILNKEAGWKALAGTADFGEVAAAKQDPGQDGLAFDLFVDRVCGFVGQYYVSLDGDVDALVFAGGIGEKSALLREKVVDQCRCLGFRLDDGRRAGALEKDDSLVIDIGAYGAKHRVLVCRTDEQFEMARMCSEEKWFWGNS